MSGHVYLIGSQKHSWYKIGKSSDARIRVAELGILLPFRIEVIAVWKAENHHALERLLHEKYAIHRINGEWFEFSGTIIKKIVKDMSKAQVPVAAGFSNLPETEKDYRIRLGLDENFPEPSEKKGGLVKRVKLLTKRNAQLRAELEKLSGLAASNLPVQ